MPDDSPHQNGKARPIATVDAVVLVLDEGMLKVAVHRRPREPFGGALALPGGYVHVDEDQDAEAAIRRILREKAGMGGFYLEQLGTFSGADRDPRGWSLSVAWVALLPVSEFAPEDPEIVLIDASDPGDLAFDHATIVAAAMTRLRGKGAYSTLPAMLLPELFTLTELQYAYESVLGIRLDQSAFRRRVAEMRLIDPTDELRRSAGRPAKLWRLAGAPGTFDRSIGGS